MPLADGDLPWMDGLFGFVQVDQKGLPVELPEKIQTVSNTTFWKPLLKTPRRKQNSWCDGRMDSCRKQMTHPWNTALETKP